MLLVHSAQASRAAWLHAELAEAGPVASLSCPREPLLSDLEEALHLVLDFKPDVVVAFGGGSVLDMGKALAALAQGGAPLDHLEVVGRALPLAAAPLPSVAVPTTAGTGAEVTRNAVIGVPDRRRKVSLRDDRMVPRIAIVDPALTDNTPLQVTLASGLDAVVQVIEPFLSRRANRITDALCRRDAAPKGLMGLRRLAKAEDSAARDTMAHVSLCGGFALSASGLGAVHGIAGVLGGRSSVAHGALCGALLVPVLRAYRKLAPSSRLDEVEVWIGAAFGSGNPLTRLDDWIRRIDLLPRRMPWEGEEAEMRCSIGGSLAKRAWAAFDEATMVLRARESEAAGRTD